MSSTCSSRWVWQLASTWLAASAIERKVLFTMLSSPPASPCLSFCKKSLPYRESYLVFDFFKNFYWFMSSIVHSSFTLLTSPDHPDIPLFSGMSLTLTRDDGSSSRNPKDLYRSALSRSPQPAFCISLSGLPFSVSMSSLKVGRRMLYKIYIN